MSIHQEIIDAFETYIAESQLALTGCEIKKDRIKGIIKAKEKGYKTIILDDGLQDYRIKDRKSVV